MLYGDWGTSRLYVLGLAFFATGVESAYFMLAIAALMIAVAWAYTVVCRSFPEGGGVYSAARAIHPVLSVLGATLLLCGYIITAVISVVEALHYLGVPDGPWIPALGVILLLGVGALNWFGARSAGAFAMIVAAAGIGVSLVLAAACLPHLREGFGRISFNTGGSFWPRWTSFTQVVLALAGMEAVANMTGLMKKPVARTARRTIWPVLVEVVALNLLFGVALLGLSAKDPVLMQLPSTLADVDLAALALTDPAAAEHVRSVQNTAMALIAEQSSTHLFGPGVGGAAGKASSIVFALLLLSAVNTAVMAMVSVLFAMAQDRELPGSIKRLNYSGVPTWGLVVSVAACVLILLIEHDPPRLAELYVIGVCGAITVTILSCAINRGLSMRVLERAGLAVLAGFLLLVTLTIAVTKTNATIFVASTVGVVLAARWTLAKRAEAKERALVEPSMGWLAELQRPGIAPPSSGPRIMLAARGRDQARYAVDLAKSRGATLFTIFVRTLRLMDVQPGRIPRVEEDAEAQEALGTASRMAREAGVAFVPIYVTSAEIADEILDYTVTYGCDTLIMGATRRSAVGRRLAGDVVARVAEHLPPSVQLMLRAPDDPVRKRGD